MRKIRLNNPKSYREAGQQLLDIVNLNNIQITNLNNFLRNVIPRYMNKTIQKGQVTIKFSDWYLDNSNIPSDKRCIALKLSREVSLMAMANITIDEYKVNGEVKFNNITYRIPVELTRIPILSEQGSFIIKGIDRVMVSHLENAKGVNVSIPKPEEPVDSRVINININTALGKSIDITRTKERSNLSYKFKAPNPDLNNLILKRRRSTRPTVDINIYDVLKACGIDNLSQLKTVVGDNLKMTDNYKLEYSEFNLEEILHNIDLSVTERERINRRLSFKSRLVDCKLNEDVTVGAKVFKKGTIIEPEMAEEMQNAGIKKVMIEAPIGIFPVWNNGFIPADKIYEDTKDIPELFNHYDSDSVSSDKIDGYLAIDKDEYENCLKVIKEDGIDATTYLKHRYDYLVGNHITKNDIIALVNLFSFVEVGLVEADDIDSLTNKAVVNISTIFENLLAEQIFGIGARRETRAKSFVDKVITSLNNFKMHVNSISPLNFSNLNCEDNNTITSRLLRDPLNKLFQRESNVNPMDEISHKRKITLVSVGGRGGVNPERAMAKARSVNPSHLGRICPIETPEGEMIGLNLNLAALARVNEYDMVEAPFFKVNKQKGRIDYSTVYCLTYDEEEHYTRAIAPQIATKDECYVSLTKNGVEVDSVDLQPIYQIVDDKLELVNADILKKQAKDIFNSYDKSKVNAYELKVHRKDWFKSDLIDCIQGSGNLIKAKWEDIDLVTCRGEHIFSAVASVLPFSEYNDGTRLMMGVSMSRQSEPTIGSDEPYIITPLAKDLGKESMSVIKSPVDAVVTDVNSKFIKILSLEENNEEEITIPLEQCKISSEFTKISNLASVKVGDIVLKGDILAGSEAVKDGKLTSGTNLIVAYMPWEGYNFEDAIIISDRLVNENILTSYRVVEQEFEFNSDFDFRITDTAVSNEKDDRKFRARCDSNGIIKVGKKVRTGDTIALKYTNSKDPKDKYKVNVQRYDGIDEGVITRIIPNKVSNNITLYTIQITTKEKIKVGDKLAGRHGNKGVIGNILPRWKMPYLEDGTSVDIILTPLGIPSRMNIGQLLESQLGLILKEAGLQVVNEPGVDVDIPKLKALLNNYTGDEDGKLQLYDGRTGKPFDQKTNVGVTVINKLKHLSAHKISARSAGVASQYDTDGQPTRGKKNFGGQKIGEMEMWVLAAHGASACAKEWFPYKSDDVSNRLQFKYAIKNNEVDKLDFKQNFTNSYRRVMSYLTALGIEIDHTNSDGETIDIYKDVSSLTRKSKFYNNTKRMQEEQNIKPAKEETDVVDKLNDILGGDIFTTDDLLGNIYKDDAPEWKNKLSSLEIEEDDDDDVDDFSRLEGLVIEDYKKREDIVNTAYDQLLNASESDALNDYDDEFNEESDKLRKQIEADQEMLIEEQIRLQEEADNAEESDTLEYDETEEDNSWIKLTDIEEQIDSQIGDSPEEELDNTLDEDVLNKLQESLENGIINTNDGNDQEYDEHGADLDDLEGYVGDSFVDDNGQIDYSNYEYDEEEDSQDKYDYDNEYDYYEDYYESEPRIEKVKRTGKVKMI